MATEILRINAFIETKSNNSDLVGELRVENDLLHTGHGLYALGWIPNFKHRSSRFDPTFQPKKIPSNLIKTRLEGGCISWGAIFEVWNPS